MPPCPPDNTPIQDGEFRIDADLTSGQAQGVIWQANNTALIIGTTGARRLSAMCGRWLLYPFVGQPMGNCLTDVTMNDAVAVLAYPALM